MPLHQSVNMRHGYANMVFGDDETRIAFEAECERVRSAQRFKYAVAPRQELTVYDLDGKPRKLGPGDEVTTDHFRMVHGQRVAHLGQVFDTGTLAPWRQLEMAVERGVVLERY